MAVLDWLQASKSGYATNIQQINAYIGVINITLGALPSAPNFGPNTQIFDPTMSMSTIQSAINQVYSSSGQFVTMRSALLFKPGSYSLDIRLTITFRPTAWGCLRKMSK